MDSQPRDAALVARGLRPRSPPGSKLSPFDRRGRAIPYGELRPDVILLDIGMPKLNGYEACRRIRRQQDGTPPVIIAQSGWGQEEDRQRTREAGFDHHLVKPVAPAALMKLLAGLKPATALSPAPRDGSASP